MVLLLDLEISPGVWESNTETPSIKEFFSTVVYLAGKKQYLQEPSVKVIPELVEKLPAQPMIIDHVLEAEVLREWFDNAHENENPDALLLALKLREGITVDSQAFGKLFPYPFSSSAIFGDSHLSTIVNCLKDYLFDVKDTEECDEAESDESENDGQTDDSETGGELPQFL